VRTLVIGATGHVGTHLLPLLAAEAAAVDGGQVRVLVRSAERAAPLWNAGFDVILGDLADADAVKRAVADVDAVLHLAPADQDATVRLAQAALNAGVRRFVYLTGRRPGAESELRRLHREEGLGLRLVRLVRHADLAQILMRTLMDGGEAEAGV
jgi:uncharacterized protein YbjT (DUF2867 family)